MNNEIPKLHLITFGANQHFARAARKLSIMGKKSGLFASSIYVGREYLSECIMKDIQEIFLATNSMRGFGLWIWKPYVILKRLNEIADDEILLYLDAGCYLNLQSDNARKRLLDYVSIAYENNILGMQLRSGNFDIEDLSEIAWSSQNLHQRLNLPLSEQESNQIQAGIIFISKNEFSLRFISQWLAIMREGNFQYLMGNNIGVSSRFKQHRYDQSIFSMLYKFSKLKAVDDETFFHPNWQEEGENYPIWAMRNRDGVDPFKLHFSDLIFKIVRRLNRFFHKYSL